MFKKFEKKHRIIAWIFMIICFLGCFYAGCVTLFFDNHPWFCLVYFIGGPVVAIAAAYLFCYIAEKIRKK